MGVKACVSLADQLIVEAFFAPALFIPGDKQDCVPAGIKREGYAPDTIGGVKAQFLHVGVARPLECIHTGTA